MASLWRATTGRTYKPDDHDGVEFWSNPERTGWLTKLGEYIKTWRRRLFVLKQGKLFWFKDSSVTRASRSRGMIPVATCLTVKGAEDVLNKQYAFELSTRSETMYFIADSEKEKEDWINSIRRSIVQHSRSVTDSQVVDYDSYKKKKKGFYDSHPQLLTTIAVQVGRASRRAAIVAACSARLHHHGEVDVIFVGMTSFPSHSTFSVPQSG